MNKEKIKDLFTKIVFSANLIKVAFRYPMFFSQIKTMVFFYKALQNVAKKKDPIVITVTTKDSDRKDCPEIVLKCWIGVGEDAEPMERIEELAKENEVLRKKVRK